MVAVLTLSPESLAHPPSSRALARMAANHELILVCDHGQAPELVGAVRTLLPRHRVVALLIDGTLLNHERELLEELLNVGHLPVVCVVGDPGTARLTEWLGADAALVLRAESAAA
jgi:uncharacterized protein (DUF58 family)